MGIPDRNDGSIVSCSPDGTDIQQVLTPGEVHTPKQLKFDHNSGKLLQIEKDFGSCDAIPNIDQDG